MPASPAHPTPSSPTSPQPRSTAWPWRRRYRTSHSGPGKAGVAALRRAVDAWTPGIGPGSPAEMRLLRRIAECGLEEPERQIEVIDAGERVIGRIDLGWRRRKVGFEYDSDRFHNPRHRERDETRQVRYAATGWEVRRVGKHVNWLDEVLRRWQGRPAA